VGSGVRHNNHYNLYFSQSDIFFFAAKSEGQPNVPFCPLPLARPIFLFELSLFCFAIGAS
jgi:hypothetical protein